MHSSPPETRASLIRPKMPTMWLPGMISWPFILLSFFESLAVMDFKLADAENLIQEILLSISLALPRWLEREDRGRFRAWLLNIARNEAVDMLTRKATRPLGQDGEAAARLLGEIQDHRHDLSSQFDLEYEHVVFQWAAAQIRDSVSDTTWQSFWLTHVEGLSIDMAAQQLNMRPGTVYVARGRVMNRIKEFVKQFEDNQ